MKVTVIAQCYNHERFLVECLDSIAAQTWQDFELVIIDDRSKDQSVDRIREWIASRRPQSRLLALEVNRGVSGAFNAARGEVSGEYVIRVATDDVWEPTLLATLLAELESRPPEFAVAFSNASCIDEASRPLPDDFLSVHRPGFTPESGDQFDALTIANYVPAPTVLMRRAALDAVGWLDERLVYEDWDLWVRLAEHYQFVYVPQLLARYRIVQGSLARTLFEQPVIRQSASLLLTNCLMGERLMGMRRLSAPARQQWRNIHFEQAWRLYCSADTRARRRLLAGLPHYRSLRAVAASLAAVVGVAPRTNARLFRLPGPG